MDELNLRDNTLVVVMGDNGTKEPFTHILNDGSKFQGNKGATKTNGLQVPLVLSWPGKIPTQETGYRTYQGMVDVVDIYPTIADAMGIKIPNRVDLDGISFWEQAQGTQADHHRDVIYTWYNANYSVNDLSNVVRYAFNKDFKRYAPHKDFPNGRFFDLRSDPYEDAGDKKVMLPWQHFYKDGLDIESIDPTQKAAYEKLGDVLEDNRYVAVESIQVEPVDQTLKPGQTVQLHHQVFPATATRKNVIWHSSDPSVAKVNKFGELTTKSSGTATITLYCWDDALPMADGRAKEYSQDGIKAKIEINVSR